MSGVLEQGGGDMAQELQEGVHIGDERDVPHQTAGFQNLLHFAVFDGF